MINIIWQSEFSLNLFYSNASFKFQLNDNDKKLTKKLFSFQIITPVNWIDIIVKQKTINNFIFQNIQTILPKFYKRKKNLSKFHFASSITFTIILEINGKYGKTKGYRSVRLNLNRCFFNPKMLFAQFFPINL